MKRLYFSLLGLLIFSHLFSQKKEFEGVLEYKVEVVSKKDNISSKNIRTLLFLGDKLTIFVKQGKCKRITDICEEYYIPELQKAFIKFKGIDTLFFVEYNSDTTKLLGVNKTNETATIVGYECKVINFKYASSTTKHFYAPALYVDPKHDASNTIGNYNIYTRETESIWLCYVDDDDRFNLKETCTKIDNKQLSDDAFKLPELPQRKFDLNSIITSPEFLGRGNWQTYLEQNLNAQLGAKYIKIPKGESEAKQTVQVMYVISTEGEISEIKVLNKDEVHKKLAEEAMRVIKESPGWKAANIFGVKIPYTLIQPVTFVALKE